MMNLTMLTIAISRRNKMVNVLDPRLIKERTQMFLKTKQELENTMIAIVKNSQAMEPDKTEMICQIRAEFDKVVMVMKK
jgi:hypothetical protein